MGEDSRVRRALLFIPGDDPKKIRKGAGLGADTVILDIEDGVALSNKAAARQTIFDALTDEALDFGRTERLVRVNPASTGWQAEDVAATITARPDGYVLPKAERADEVQRLADAIAEGERRAGIEPGTCKLIAIIETALGVVNLREIAASHPRLVGLMFGAEDLAGSIGAVRTPEGLEIAYARSAVVLHAAAYGLQAVDMVYTDFQDLDGLRRETRTAIQMGFTGKTAIHPAQVRVIEEAFTPSDEEVARARQIVRHFEMQQADGTGVFAYEGKMVDMPMLRQAQRVLARARASGNL